LRELWLGLVLVSPPCLAAASPTPGVAADLVLVGGRVWTVDAARPEAQGLAVLGERILAVGSDAEIRALVGSETRVIELGGRLVLPGFDDSHTHFLDGGFWLSGVKLKDAATPEEFGERLAAHAKTLPEGAWITGGTWDHDRWPGGELPTAALIDRYVPDRPVFVVRYDGHMSVANSLALRLAGVTAATPDPEGGRIVRRPGSHEPAGVLRDAAQDLVQSAIPEPSREEKRRALEAALAEARRVGVTSLTDMNMDPEHLRLYQELLREGKLTARIDGRWWLSEWRALAALGIEAGFEDRHFIALGGLKGMLDGSLGSSTALFFEPYVGSDDTGLYVTPIEELRRDVIEATRAGLHPAIHAIGDRAVSETLDVFAEAARAAPGREHRFRVEHAQHLVPADFARFAALGVIASVQPYHAIDDGRWAAGRIGEERCSTTYAFRSFLDAGVTLAFGSDWTVAPLDPLLGIEAAVNRRTTDGANPGGWFPEQRLTVEEAVEAYTLGSARASFSEGEKGTLTPGKLADLVVLSRDILTGAGESLPEARVELTVVGGRVVFGAGRLAQ